MIYGYVSIDVTDDKSLLDKQISMIDKYVNKINESISVKGEIVDISTKYRNLDYKKKLKELQEIVKEGDTVVFATLDSISPDWSSVSAVLSALYYKNVNVVALDFPVLQSIKIDPYLLCNTSKHLLYITVLSPLLEYRYMINKKGVKNAI